MKKLKTRIYALSVCIIAGLLFTILIYNYKFKYLIVREIVITLTYCALFLVVHYKFKLPPIQSAFFTFLTPFIIDFSVVFTNNDLIPIRFPYATSFLMMGIIMGYLLQKSIRYKIAGIAFTLFYLFIAWYWIIPYLITRTEEVKTQYSDSFFSTNVLNQNGDTIVVRSLSQKATVIDFFFVGCPPCEEKRKMLEAVKSKISDQRFIVLLICDGSITTFNKFQEYCIKNPPKIGFQILYDFDKNIPRYFPKISGYPFEIDFEYNRVVKSYLGFSSEGFEYSKKIRIQTINKILND